MVDWIMTFYVNGDLHGWFRDKRGLRQGDPLSPYLFTMVMEILILILQQRVSESKGLKEFKNVSGLVPSIPKSTAFFCNVPNALKATILNTMQFAELSLPVRVVYWFVSMEVSREGYLEVLGNNLCLSGYATVLFLR
ncbi:hypothetical protein Tco_0620592 [Tanacetum coccineum]